MSWYLKREDNAPLILFRILFGLLMAWQCAEYLRSGWVTRNLVRPEFTFSHIGTEWLQPLPGSGMYWYFGIMAVLGLLTAAGCFYRWSLGLLTLMWWAVYLMQKTVYNNHHYLLLLTGMLLLFLPAAKGFSVDAYRRDHSSSEMPAWCRYVMMLQIAIVYLFASVAKLYPGWFDGSYMAIVLTRHSVVPGLSFFAEGWFHKTISWLGFAFDLLVIPGLLFRRTRNVALIASLVFHLFNHFTLWIGIFPFFALSFALFFYPPDDVRRFFFPKKSTEISPDARLSTNNRHVLLCFFVPYFLIQLFLPIRHWFIPGDVLWTEEGHRLSWRMMLRQRSGSAEFTVSDIKTGAVIPYDVSARMTPIQFKMMRTHPDMIWQMAQRIRKEYADAGIEVSVRVKAYCAINRGKARLLVDPETDLAHSNFDYFTHSPWILLYPEND